VSNIHLVIGNKNYSSWSLRPWMALSMAGIPFRETVIPLDTPETAALIAQHSGAGRVPVLHHGRQVVWESLAIMEYLAELFPEKHLWPKAVSARAVARAVANEMHAGFGALRNACPIRMRPVLMTSATIILALFPAALGLGAGAETNQPLSIAVIGGMISSTLLTLVVVPAVYSLVEHRLEKHFGKPAH